MEIVQHLGDVETAGKFNVTYDLRLGIVPLIDEYLKTYSLVKNLDRRN